LKESLYLSSKEFVEDGQTTIQTSRDEKNESINRVVEAHEALAGKMTTKNAFLESLTFSIKVLLPTHINNPTLFVLYTKLIESKLSKKLVLLIKK
jgi:hypothetical protein